MIYPFCDGIITQEEFDAKKKELLGLKKSPCCKHGLKKEEFILALKVIQACPQCLNQMNESNSSWLNAMYAMEVGNEDTFEFTCANGHKNTFFLNVPRFSLHFENGLEAYLNENYIEAFISFYSALEDYRLEFAKSYLYMFCEVPYKDLCNGFKGMSKFSERILGAYVLAYLAYFKRPVDTKQTKNFHPIIVGETVNLRNNVVHKGHYPSKKEVEELGTTIYEHIKYQTKHYTHISNEVEFPVLIDWGIEKRKHWMESQSNKKDNPNIELINSDISTMRTAMDPKHDEIKSFDELLDNHKKLKKLVMPNF